MPVLWLQLHAFRLDSSISESRKVPLKLSRYHVIQVLPAHFAMPGQWFFSTSLPSQINALVRHPRSNALPGLQVWCLAQEMLQ